MLIQLHGEAKDAFTYYLRMFEAKSGNPPSANERTEAFQCARAGTKPSWFYQTNMNRRVASRPQQFVY